MAARGKMILKLSDVELITSRINGYLMAMSSIDGYFGESVSDAYVSEVSVNADNLHSLLVGRFKGFGCLDYKFGEVIAISSPWSRPLGDFLNDFLLKNPFGCRSACKSQLRDTRENMVLRIVDMVGIVTEVFACDKIFCVEMGFCEYSGFMYVFPLERWTIFLKCCRKNAPANVSP